MRTLPAPAGRRRGATSSPPGSAGSTRGSSSGVPSGSAAGTHPSPARGDLRAVVTGKLEKDDFVVEKLHFQSLPGLYVTANLYLPKQIAKPLPKHPDVFHRLKRITIES